MKPTNPKINTPGSKEEAPPILRHGQRILTNSFSEDPKNQNNFLHKAAILKHLIKQFVLNREKKVLKASRSIRDNYQQKVKDNKLHSIINKGLVGIVKEERNKSLKIETRKKKNSFLRKPTNVKNY